MNSRGGAELGEEGVGRGGGWRRTGLTAWRATAAAFIKLEAMGNTATKFRKALVGGDEGLAWQLYEGNPQFRESLDPNASYGEQYQHNTALHYVCRHAMTRLLR